MADVSIAAVFLKAKGGITNNNPKNKPRRNSFTQPELPQLFDFITRLTQGERSISTTSIRKRVASVFKKLLKGLSSSSHVSPQRPDMCRVRLQPPATAETRDEPPCASPAQPLLKAAGYNVSANV